MVCDEMGSDGDVTVVYGRSKGGREKRRVFRKDLGNQGGRR